MESADGDENIARVALAEDVGAEPSPSIKIDAMSNAPPPESLTASIEELIGRALTNRPYLAAQAAEIRAADDRIRFAQAEYRPHITLSAAAGQTSIWPTADYGRLGSANEPTWSAVLGVEWKLFDGGRAPQ
jgi:outer membrane protein